MNIPVLVIKLHGKRVGQIFKFDAEGSPPVIRFVVDTDFAVAPFERKGVLSESFRAPSPELQASFWLNAQAQEFNGRQGKDGDWQLPAFFQNLLPEGTFRQHVAEEAEIDPRDHFSMLAACGKNLSGAVTAEWEDVSRADLQHLVTQDQDALEMSVWSEPFQGAISISGVQPKLALSTDDAGRFVGRTSLGDAHIIAKLPTIQYPRMPQVEDLSMRLAKLAGVAICEFSLHALADLGAPHRYDLGTEYQDEFLAVKRFDRIKSRGVTRRIHFEDFAQVLGVLPEKKYSASYLDIAAVLMGLPGCGEMAVHELLRRIEVNELLGNTDMHLKNLGLLYVPTGKPADSGKGGAQGGAAAAVAMFAPAYDIASTVVYLGARGHALRLFDGQKNNMQAVLTPITVKAFCDALEIGYPMANKVVRDVAKEAAEKWLEPIVRSGLTAGQKATLIGHFVASAHGGAVLGHKSNPDLRASWHDALDQQRELAGASPQPPEAASAAEQAHSSRGANPFESSPPARTPARPPAGNPFLKPAGKPGKR